MSATGLKPRTTYFVNEHSIILPNWPNDSVVFWVIICTVCFAVYSCLVPCAFQSDTTVYSCLNVKETLLWSRPKIWSLSDCNWTLALNYLVCKQTFNYLAKLAKWLSSVLSSYLYAGIWLLCFHVTYTFQNASIFYSVLNFKELVARRRRDIWSLSDFKWTQTQNHLFGKGTLTHSTELSKWFSCVLSYYLFGVFDCIFLSIHVRVSE